MGTQQLFVQVGTTQPICCNVTRTWEQGKMAGDNDRTCLDFCSRTCPERHSEEELHSNEEGCGGLPHLGGNSQPGQGDRGESQSVGERPNNRKVSGRETNPE